MADGRGNRFASTTEAEQQEKRLGLNAQKTLKANRGAAKLFKEYLSEKGSDPDFENFAESVIDQKLSQFYMDLRKTDGEKYKVNSMESIRHGINRYLRSPPFNKTFDIIKDGSFGESNQNFKAVLAELKRVGKGSVTHHAAISEADLQKLYNSLHMSTDTPQGLYNKVQFDIRLYFCRRGNENMCTMSKETFRVRTDENSGKKYVEKAVDELTKNHRFDKEASSGVMPAMEGSSQCPVASFELYLSKLHPYNDREVLWQRPKDSYVADDTTCYANVPVGEKKLSAFMSDLSKAAGLSQKYTNHSIRATGATILSKGMFGPSQVMDVTGHKSVQSLSVYQRVSDGEKIQMGQVLSKTLVPSSSNALVPVVKSATCVRDPLSCIDNAPVKRNAIGPSSTISSVSSTDKEASQDMEIAVAHEIADVNMDDLFCDFFKASDNTRPMECSVITNPKPHMPPIRGPKY
ncbi:hypothetical protein FSP39_017969 [Pinctada imbricata]|uniref:Tyr recombinase domain-containing protein n=1 Tax=Pinctada imbricata TaxID=66713 RepID=A0AA88XIQ5_PINIB|nr:hypothetical protein FSP39_017969 [Pinctada imbricata]